MLLPFLIPQAQSPNTARCFWWWWWSWWLSWRWWWCFWIMLLMMRIIVMTFLANKHCWWLPLEFVQGVSEELARWLWLCSCWLVMAITIWMNRYQVCLQLYENLLEPGTAAWLDTVGWEDRWVPLLVAYVMWHMNMTIDVMQNMTDQKRGGIVIWRRTLVRTKDDKETFREILAYIHQHKMAEVGKWKSKPVDNIFSCWPLSGASAPPSELTPAWEGDYYCDQTLLTKLNWKLKGRPSSSTNWRPGRFGKMWS